MQTNTIYLRNKKFQIGKYKVIKETNMILTFKFSHSFCFLPTFHSMITIRWIYFNERVRLSNPTWCNTLIRRWKISINVTSIRIEKWAIRDCKTSASFFVVTCCFTLVRVRVIFFASIKTTSRWPYITKKMTFRTTPSISNQFVVWWR